MREKGRKKEKRKKKKKERKKEINKIYKPQPLRLLPGDFQ